MPSPYDVIVVGLGGMGSAAAYHLAARGRRVLGLERFPPVHDRGASHGGSRIIRQAYFEDPAYVPLLLRAYELWSVVDRSTGRAGDPARQVLTVTGGLMIGAEDSHTVRGSVTSARQWGLAHEILDAAEITRRVPTLTPGQRDVALFEALAGFVRPEESVRAHLALAERAGADLRFSEPVTSWTASPTGEGVRVVTDRGAYEAGRLVVCPGPWAGELLADLGVEFVVERQVQYWFDPVCGTGPYAPDRHPIYIWEEDASLQFYGFPATDGPAGGVKTAFFRRGEETAPDAVDRSVREEEVAFMRRHLSTRVPSLPGELLRAKTCLYTNSPDQHFVIAAHPEHPQVAVACGFSGHGFKFVSVVGEVLADLTVDGATRHPIGLFDPARFSSSPQREVTA